MCNKTTAIRQLIVENSIDILCINESWLSEEDTPVIADMLPDTHNFHHYPRAEGRGGRVAFVVTKKVKKAKSFRRKFNTFECLQLRCNFNGKVLDLFSIYRPPGSRSAFFHEFEDFLLSSTATPHEIFYVGDFNVWIDDLNDPDTIRFLNILDDYNLLNHVRHATYDSGHILDLFIARSDSEIIRNVLVEEICTLSDHRMVSFDISVPILSKLEKTIKFRRPDESISSVFESSMNDMLSRFGGSCVHDSHMKCVNCLSEIFRCIAGDVYESHAPLIEKTIKIVDSSKLWYCSEINQAKRHLRKAEKAYIRNKCELTRAEYVRLRQEKDRIVQGAKVKYYTSNIEKCGSDSKKLYKELNRLLGKYCIKNASLPEHSSRQKLANEFKNFFISKIEKINSSFNSLSSPNVSSIPDFPLITFSEFCPVSVENISSYVAKTKKTFCPNDPIDLKKIDFCIAGEKLYEVISEIVNSSFKTGTFPDSEKFSYVRPMLKPGKSSEDLLSYRPLYNTSFLSKVLEHAALDQLKSHLNKFNYFSRYQSAYREFHSVETAMCKIYNDLVISKACGDCTLLILLDQSAAFDTVIHDILLNDFSLLGIDGNVLNWFKSYVKGRLFKVLIGDDVSDEGFMASGVPQGSVLGPILFSIYTTELSYILESLGVCFHFYADDTQLYFCISNFNQNLDMIDRVMSTIKNWMTSKRLKLNEGKTEVILIGSKVRLENINRPEHCIIDGVNLAWSTKVRSLGVVLDENLNMKDHLRQQKKKLVHNLINISRIAKFLNKGTKMKLVHGLILSNIDFCNSILHGLPDCDLRMFQLIINSAARTVAGMPRFSRERITPICIDLHILPVKARIKYKICLLAHKALTSGEPKYLADLLHRRETVSSLRSSSVRQLEEPIISRSSSSNRAFAYCAPRLYNTLPGELRTIESVGTFKKKLKTYIFSEAYDVNEQCITESFKL